MEGSMGPKSVGTMDSPLVGDSSLDVAKAMLKDKWWVNGRRHVHVWKGSFWVWQGGVWSLMSEEEVVNESLEWVNGAYQAVYGKNGEVVGAKKIGFSVRFVEDVVRCLRALANLKVEKMPTWLGEAKCDPDFVIAFEDVVVDVMGWVEKGVPVTYPRDEGLFEQQVVRCKWDEKAESPLLARCLHDWSGGDKAWQECWLREMGYRGLGFRGLRTWFMHYGRTQAGKTTGESIERGIWGEAGYMGKRMSSLGRNFGLHKLAIARRFVVSEVVDLEKGERNESSALVKNVVGQDAIDLDRKHKEELENVVSQAVVVMLGNELPKLPNKGRGLSSKMVPLNFDTSFERTKDERLVEKVLMERAGVARMFVEGAVRLMASKGDERWPLTEGAAFALHRFEALNNPADEFLGWAFTKDKEGFVDTDLVWGLYVKWCEQMRFRMEARNQFNAWLEENNSWGVGSARRFKEGRTFRGIRMKAGGPGFETERERESREAVFAV